MAVEKYTPLAQITLTSSASSVTFGSIPSGYRDLYVVCSIKLSGSTGGVVLQVNGDTGSNYPIVTMHGSGSSALSTSETYTFAQVSYFTSYPTTAFGNLILQYMDYSATDKHKTILARADALGTGTTATAARWANTAAITSTTIFPPSRSFDIGSTFRLWGVK